MSHPSSLLQRAVLQPRVANGYTTFCGVNGDGTRLAVGWDTGSERGVSTFVTRPGWPEGCRGTSWEEIPDLDLTTELDGELNAIALSGNGKRLAVGDCYNVLPSGCVKIFEFIYADYFDSSPKKPPSPPRAGPTAGISGAPLLQPGRHPPLCRRHGLRQRHARRFRLRPGRDDLDADRHHHFARHGCLGTAVAVNVDETLLAVGAKETGYFAGRVYVLAKVGGVFHLRDTIEAVDNGRPVWRGRRPLAER